MQYELTDIAAALLRGAIVTVEVTSGALAVATLLGLALAALRFLARSRAFDWALGVYVEVFRNVPSLMHLFLIFFGLPSLGIKLDPVPAGILGLGLIGGAVLTEVFRAGIDSVGRGQQEAALAAGMRPFVILRSILLPQAWRVSLPPYGNYAVGLVKDTSLVSAIAAPEIMFKAREIVNQTFQTSVVYLIAALIYLAIIAVINTLVRKVERHVSY
jgi:polar amino acid transport system permease protein